MRHGRERGSVIIASGSRSLLMASYLMRAGVDAYSLTGGTGAWARAGHAIVMGSRPRGCLTEQQHHAAAAR